MPSQRGLDSITVYKVCWPPPSLIARILKQAEVKIDHDEKRKQEENVGEILFGWAVAINQDREQMLGLLHRTRASVGGDIVNLLPAHGGLATASRFLLVRGCKSSSRISRGSG